MLDVVEAKALRPTNVTLCYAEDLQVGDRFYADRQYTKFKDVCVVQRTGIYVQHFTRDGGHLDMGIYFDEIVAKIHDTAPVGATDV